VLRWSHVVAWVESDREWRPVTEIGFDHEKFAAYEWRSVREDGDTKTDLSCRTLEIPEEAATALRQHRKEKTTHRLTTGNA
jgi:hypothetical protein